MRKLPLGWVPASRAAAMVVRAVYGPTATFGYLSVPKARNRGAGRYYYVHVADVLGPLETRFYNRMDLERLEQDHGSAMDSEIAAEMIVPGIKHPPAEQILDWSYWEVP